MNLEKADNFENLQQFEEEVTVDSKSAIIVGINYLDKYFISISSNGKIGGVLIANSIQTLNSEGDLVYTYSVKTLFGQEEPILEVFSRSLCEKLRTDFSISKPLLIAVGVSKDQLNISSLKQYENSILKAIRK